MPSRKKIEQMLTEQATSTTSLQSHQKHLEERVKALEVSINALYRGDAQIAQDVTALDKRTREGRREAASWKHVRGMQKQMDNRTLGAVIGLSIEGICIAILAYFVWRKQ